MSSRVPSTDLDEPPRPASLAAASIESLDSTRSRLATALHRSLASPAFHLLLFALTVITTVNVGARFAAHQSLGLANLDWGFSRAFFADFLRHPWKLAAGLPFSATLLGILLAHELGHYFACRYYGIKASYPYFIPAPTLIGTLGAFIRIKSPIITRRALFDVGFSGPVVGFLVAMPTLVWAIVHSTPEPAAMSSATAGTISLGSPLVLSLLVRLLRPGLEPAVILHDPVGCAVWVGLFATALNLLPVSQLDGGHILYALLGDKHKLVSRGFFLGLFPLGVFCWPGWMIWALLLLALGLRHPVTLIPHERLGRGRTILAAVAAIMLVLCFMPTPFSIG